MNEALPKSNQMTWPGSVSAISSLVSESGVAPCDALGGPMTEKSGPDHVPASPSAQQGSEAGSTTNGISGPSSIGSLVSAVPRSSLESKSLLSMGLHGLMVKERRCKACETEKPLSEFYSNYKGNHRWTCKICEQDKERGRKRKNPEQTAKRFKDWRDKRRGYALVNVAKNRAKARGLPFDLSSREIQARVDAGVCELTDIPFDLSQPRGWNAPSLDQIVPGRGYTTANVRVVLYALNVMANTWGPEKILEIASAISQRRKNASERLS